jgi:hypothetical protein
MLGVKPEGKRPLEGSKRRWEDNIKINLNNNNYYYYYYYYYLLAEFQIHFFGKL